MPKAVTIVRADLTVTGLRQAAAWSDDANAARRMLGLALVLEGYTRGEAARLCGMDRQTLRDWVIRYNAEGVAGLSDRTSPGPKPRLTPEQEEAVAELVRKGPDLAKDGVVRWRRVDLAGVIKTRFNVTLAERSVGAMLRRLGFRRLSVRPRHPQQDPAAQETHKKTLPIWSKPPSPSMRANNRLELWWQDEARVGQQGTLTRVWAERGSRPLAPRDQRREWAYIFGAICPHRDIGAALVLPCANAQAMNLHLEEISSQVAQGSHAVLLLDRAGWHQTGGKLRVPKNISLLHLPPYSPELNPAENIWQFLRQNHLSNRVFESYTDIVDACCAAWNTLIEEPKRITSIATRDWASVSP
jgi:transposase